MSNEITLKITIDGKEAIGQLELTDENIKQLYQSFKYGQQEVNGFTTALSRGLNNAREMIIGLKEAFGIISQSFSTHLQAYQEQEAALIKLNTALQQTGQYTEENLKALTDYAAQLQQTTIYGDEVTETVMAQLLAMGLSVEQTKQATLQVANLATIMGTDLNSAARAMADLFNGNVGMIGRYIKGLDETIIKSGDLDKILQMLNERIGGQAEAIGRTSVGAIARMNNAIGDLKENTGLLISQALEPFVKILANVTSYINNLSPEVSGFIGLVASLTTAFITLRVTGIIPAIQSIELFGIAITGLRATLIKSGIGALIVVLGYGLYELAKAYEHYDSVVNNKKASEQALLETLRKQAQVANRKELEWMLKDAEEQSQKIQSRINELKKDIENSYEIRTNRDKDGYEYTIKQETEKTKELKTQLELLKDQLNFQKEAIKIYQEQISKPKISRRETIATPSTSKIEKPEIPELPEITAEMEDVTLKQMGDIREYARLSQEEELQWWYEKELMKIQEYENFIDMKKALDEEYLRRKQDILDKEVEYQIDATQKILQTTAGLFKRQTAAYKALAISQTIIETYKAATAALSPPPIGAGPVLGPILAAATIATGLANVAKIAATKVEGFLYGGKIQKGQIGFIEGQHAEIIAPERTFVEVFREELRPKIFKDINPTSIETIIDKVVERIDQWQREIVFRFDGMDWTNNTIRLIQQKKKLSIG
jgi:hypothetical protein